MTREPRIHFTGTHRNVRWPNVAALVGTCALLELLAETGFGLSHLTLGSPLAYRGVLIELPGALWFLALLTVLRVADASHDEDRRRRLNLYLFGWTILGLAAGLWALQNAGASSYRAWQYWLALAAIVVLFVTVSSSEFAGPFAAWQHLGSDLRSLSSHRATWAFSAFGVVVIAVAPTVADVPSRRPPILRGQALLDWFDTQPRTVLPSHYITAGVVVATFIDYECPSCRAAERETEPLFAELSREFGGSISFQKLHFPLNTGCNPTFAGGTLHKAACEAAVVAELAARAGPEVSRAAEAWLWDNQVSLTPAKAREFANTLTRGPDAAADLAVARDRVLRESAIGVAIGIRATPTYWINGVVVRRLPLADLRQIIVHELARVDARNQDGPTGQGGYRP